jgi:integrase
MAHVQSATSRAYFKVEEERGVTAKTYNNELIFLRAVFHALRKDAGLAENPFDGIPTQDGETVFRKPFNADELKLIVEHAKCDQFVYPLVITGICTAMRRGDCCTLLRKSVDLQSGFVTVKTSKTGEYVQIPIFPLLREVLEKAMAGPSPGVPHYVFPALAAHYSTNPDHLTDRVRRVMRAAGFFDEKDATGGKVSRGGLSQERERGLRRASLRDFHSFRVTWVTIALTAGVPLEIVQRVTGHRTAGIVMKHYFQPGREEFRRTLAGKMPALLGGPTTSEPITIAKIRETLRGMTGDTWMDRRDELLRQIDESNGTLPRDSNRAA